MLVNIVSHQLTKQQLIAIGFKRLDYEKPPFKTQYAYSFHCLKRIYR